MSEHTPTGLFEQLLGEQLSAVTFVQDYLQLWFDGPGINVTNPLTVQTGQASVTSWRPGFRDALCSQIAKIVAAVECRDGERSSFGLRTAHSCLSLRKQDYTTPEALYAHGFRDDAWFVA